jgi:hypothetical protein
MGAKHLVCNDCGCKFQIHESKKGESQVSQKKEAGKEKAKPLNVCCPECQSYNVTTA